MLTHERIVDIAKRYGIDTLPVSHIAFVNAIYTQGALDGALAAAQARPEAPHQAQGCSFVEPKRQQQADDLHLAAKMYPWLVLDRSVRLQGKTYKLVGFKPRATATPFIIEGPQGGRYRITVKQCQDGQL